MIGDGPADLVQKAAFEMHEPAHGTLFPAGRPRMPVRDTRQAPRRSAVAGSRWWRAVGLSLGAHALGLGVMWGGATWRPAGVGQLHLPAWLAERPEAEVEAATQVDLTSIDEAMAGTTIAPPAEAAAEPPAQPGDQTTERHAESRDGLPDRRAPASDSGEGTGRLVDQPAWRRDTSTLHERVADG